MEKGEGKVADEKKKFNIKDIKKEHLILLFLAGIFLVIATVPDLFSKKKETDQVEESNVNTSTINTATTQELEEEEYITIYENKLKKLLEKMEGVGKVEVMLTLKNSEEQVVLKDMPNTQENLNETDTAGGSRISSNSQQDEETVMITTKAGETVPYVTKEIVPKVEGVVVLAQGGGNGVIATRIVNAVAVLFDVPVHKVQVLQMGQ
jgi:stage III sporulation protein AG